MLTCMHCTVEILSTERGRCDASRSHQTVCLTAFHPLFLPAPPPPPPLAPTHSRSPAPSPPPSLSLSLSPSPAPLPFARILIYFLTRSTADSLQIVIVELLPSALCDIRCCACMHTYDRVSISACLCAKQESCAYVVSALNCCAFKT